MRIQDLRHSFASRALALSESLTMIGKLLGHTKIQTTARYADLARDSVNESAARVAASIGGDLQGGAHLGPSPMLLKMRSAVPPLTSGSRAATYPGTRHTIYMRVVEAPAGAETDRAGPPPAGCSESLLARISRVALQTCNSCHRGAIRRYPMPSVGGIARTAMGREHGPHSSTVRVTVGSPGVGFVPIEDVAHGYGQGAKRRGRKSFRMVRSSGAERVCFGAA